jgi:hypothetical protein
MDKNMLIEETNTFKTNTDAFVTSETITKHHLNLFRFITLEIF